MTTSTNAAASLAIAAGGAAIAIALVIGRQLRATTTSPLLPQGLLMRFLLPALIGSSAGTAMLWMTWKEPES